MGKRRRVGLKKVLLSSKKERGRERERERQMQRMLFNLASLALMCFVFFFLQFYQSVHLSTGFIAEPSGQSKLSANCGRFTIGPMTLNRGGL